MRTAASFRALVLGASFAVLASTSMVFAEGTTPPTDPSTPSAAPGTTTPATPAAGSDATAQDPAAKGSEDEVVCRKEDATTGSRIGARKICRTVREWRAMQAEAKEVTDELQSKGRTENPAGS